MNKNGSKLYAHKWLSTSFLSEIQKDVWPLKKNKGSLYLPSHQVKQGRFYLSRHQAKPLKWKDPSYSSSIVKDMFRIFLFLFLKSAGLHV